MIIPKIDGRFNLTSEQIEQYRTNGHLLVKGLCSADEMAAYRDVVREFVANQTRNLAPVDERTEYGKMFVQTMHIWENDSRMAGLSLSPRLGGVAADLFGVDSVRIYHDQILTKEPEGIGTPWHQDGIYVPLDKPVMTMWMPLVDVTAQMGAMRFVDGSQRAGVMHLDATSSELGDRLEEQIRSRGWNVTDAIAMNAGDATFHDTWTLHSAPPNRGAVPREVLSILYYPDGARVIERGFWNAASASHLNARAPGEFADSPINPVVFTR